MDVRADRGLSATPPAREPRSAPIHLSLPMNSISPQTLALLLQQEPGQILIDVRSEEEHQRVHVAGTHLQPLSQITANSVKALLPAGEPDVYVFCERGYRARLAIEKLDHEGFKNAILVEGGTLAWINAGLPVERGANAKSRPTKTLIIIEVLLVLLALILGYRVHPGFLFALSGIALAVGVIHDWRLPSFWTSKRAPK